ncbi:MAG: proline racemase family protein [Lutimonas sp.]
MSIYERILEYREPGKLGNKLKVKTIDLHTGGEPLRVIMSGYPELAGNSVLEYRRSCRETHDHLRKLLMFEPRGHADMYGCLLTPPNDTEADFGVVFMHNEGYSTMCGHAIIALATLASEMGWIQVDRKEPLKIDTPCGRIEAWIERQGNQIEGVRFKGVPSFAVELDGTIDIPNFGTVNYDLAYGGAFYAYVNLDKNDFELELGPLGYRKLIDLGMTIKDAVANQNPPMHPFEPDLSFLYGTIFIGSSDTSGIDSRNVCVFADGEVDRCPTGSGVSGRMAIHRARNEINPGDTMRIESITGSVFSGSVLKDVDYGPYQAVIPEVKGSAYITGFHTFVLDPNDPLSTGFILR